MTRTEFVLASMSSHRAPLCRILNESSDACLPGFAHGIVGELDLVFDFLMEQTSDSVCSQ